MFLREPLFRSESALTGSEGVWGLFRGSSQGTPGPSRPWDTYMVTVP